MTIDIEQLTNLALKLEAKTKAPAPQGVSSWFDIRNSTSGNTEVYIYDNIGAFGVTAKDFTQEIQQINTPSIDLHFNCNGGEVFDGVAIYTAIKNHKSHVVGIVDGVAASAASFILMACDEIVMEKMARLMIHDARGAVYDNPQGVKEFYELLDQISDTIAQSYADRAGGTKQSWRKKMSTDAWFDAQQAVKAGLADRVADQDSPDNKASATITSNDIPEPVATFDAGMLFNLIKEGTK
jgi:ATP-dependent protease ClpP protease subunit